VTLQPSEHGQTSSIRSLLAPRAVCIAALVLSFVALSLVAQGRAAAAAEQDTWAAEKCIRYDKAFHELLDMVGRDGITEHFIKGNEAFIAAGCSNGADVCPKSEKDFDLANKLTLAAMSFGTASTFLPFVCRVK
jgi:hypothetical protein